MANNSYLMTSVLHIILRIPSSFFIQRLRAARAVYKNIIQYDIQHILQPFRVIFTRSNPNKRKLNSLTSDFGPFQLFNVILYSVLSYLQTFAQKVFSLNHFCIWVLLHS